MADTSHGVLRAQLQQERARLRDRLADLGQGSNGDLTFDGGFADSSQVTAERGEIEALTVTLAETLGEIEDALHKFDEGTYGRCERCGGPIADARLEAIPAARLCITCASKSR
ncbi:MAG TPA: TraR/DksA C4-type zinc finger protein [Acidimicrobiia bacterium]|jgi:RNA polymerase-binding transcription factor DksA|nr:TraR/DksA C4-type zinc finger protein [Acidimicrobiia bacterium]